MREEIEGQEYHFITKNSKRYIILEKIWRNTGVYDTVLENGTTVQFYRRKDGKAERILQEQRIMKKEPRRRKI